GQDQVRARAAQPARLGRAGEQRFETRGERVLRGDLATRADGDVPAATVSEHLRGGSAFGEAEDAALLDHRRRAVTRDGDLEAEPRARLARERAELGARESHSSTGAHQAARPLAETRLGELGESAGEPQEAETLAEQRCGSGH